MIRVFASIADWLDERTDYRARLGLIGAEPLPTGARWSFTLGSILIFGVIVQVVTGIALALWYAPTPDHAWDSVNFIMTGVRGGRIVRGLHYWGSTLVVSAMALYLVRVVFAGRYRKPREANWILAVVVLQVILAFAMTGYLLPWDQRAYWATVVRISIAKLTPFAGDFAATMMRGGADIGAMTLLRWYVVHTVILPLALVLIVFLHLSLKRRAASPESPLSRSPVTTYFPNQAVRDLVAAMAVGVVLVWLAWRGMPALEPQADPTSGNYIPRPEWYFAGLFQFVKMFPGRFEVIGAIMIPGIAMTFLALLPWLDRGKTRAWRDRRGVLSVVSFGIAAVATLTVIGAMDRVPRAGATWTLTEIAGASLINTGDRCQRCHKPDGIADPVQPGHIIHAQDWLAAHVADPEMIAVGLRPPPPANQRETDAILAALSRLRGGPAPATSEADQHVAVLMNHWCLSCHKVDGFGGKDGPDLTHVGQKVNADTIAQRITDPTTVDPKAEMPAFNTKLTPDEIRALAAWLAARK